MGSSLLWKIKQTAVRIIIDIVRLIFTRCTTRLMGPVGVHLLTRIIRQFLIASLLIPSLAMAVDFTGPITDTDDGYMNCGTPTAWQKSIAGHIDWLAAYFGLPQPGFVDHYVWHGVFTPAGPYHNCSLTVGYLLQGYQANGQPTIDNHNHRGLWLRPGPGTYLSLIGGECPQCKALSAGKQDPFRNAGANPGMCPLGNPINPATGNKYETAVDLAIPGPFPIQWARYYNSDLNVGPANFTTGHIGTRWLHEFQRYLIFNLNINHIDVFRQDGKGFGFTKVNNVWVSLSDVADRLSQNGTGWIYATADGDREEYDATGKLTKITNNQGYFITLEYDGTSRLVRIKDQFANTRLTVSYGTTVSLSRIINVKGPANEQFDYEYDNSGNLTRVVYPDTDDTPTGGNRANNPSRQYLYAESQHMADPVNDPKLNPYAMTGIIDENGTRYATWKYDSAGRANFSEHAGGAEQVNLTFNGTNGTTSFTDANGNSETQSFLIKNGAAKMSAVQGTQCSLCGGRPKAATYDTNGYIDSRTDFEGNITRYKHDSNGFETCRVEGIPPTGAPDSKKAYRRVLTVSDPTYRVATAIRTYDPVSSTMDAPTTCDDVPGSASWTLRREVTMTLAPGSGRVKTRTEKGYTQGVSDGPDRITTYTYYGEEAGDNALLTGLLKRVDGPRTDVSDVTNYFYAVATDSNHQIGDLIEVNNALNQSTLIQIHDADGRPKQIQDPNGTITTLTYHPRGWPLSRTVNGQTTTMTYDNVGQLDVLTAPSGALLNYDYDGAHRLIDVRDNFGNWIHYNLDLLGNRIKEETKDPSGALKRSVDRFYNTLNQLDRIVGGMGQTTRFTYDGNGNVLRTIDPRDSNPAAPTNYQENAYDALNRLRETKDNLGGITTQSRDAFDNVKSVSDPRGVLTTYAYNGFGELKQLVSPDGGTTTTTYDPAGNAITKTDGRNVTVSYQYDALNRLVLVNYPTDVDRQYFYDEAGGGPGAKGRVTRIVDSSGTTSYQYDLRGNVTRKEVSFPGVTGSRVMQYQYTAADELQQIIYPSGLRIVYTRDAVGRITTVAGPDTPSPWTVVGNVTYAPFGPITGWTYGNGTWTSVRSLDLSYRLASLRYERTPGDWLRNWSYGYDAADNITSITDNADNGWNTTYQYDRNSRLTEEKWVAVDVTADYTYDANGNQLSDGFSSYDYSWPSGPIRNQLKQLVGGTPYGYDGNGNVTSNQGLTMSYDESNRLKNYSGVVLDHNAQGGMAIEGASRPAYFTYDDHGHLLEEFIPSCNQANSYVWLDDILVGMVAPDYPCSPSSRRGILTDHLGAPVGATTGTTVGYPLSYEMYYSAFGIRLWTTVYDFMRVWRPGQLVNWNGDFWYNGYRDYVPAIGRYLQADPIGLAGDVNPYTYANNNPLRFTDPLGLYTVSFGGSASYQFKGAGGSVSATVGQERGDTPNHGRICFQVSTCGRVGPGNSAGATLTSDIGEGSFCPGNSTSAGAFAEGGFGHFDGFEMNSGTDGTSASGSFRSGIGGGRSVGTQACLTRTICVP